MYPILFKIGPFSVYSYGLMVAVAFYTAAYLIWRDAPSFGIDRAKVLDLVICILISAILGARLLHVLVNLGFYREHPMQIFNLMGGGLAFYGGLVSAFAVSVWFIRKNRLPFSKMSDLIAPYLALAQAIGRVGCFLNGCCWGKESSFGIAFPFDNVIRHPTQVYSAISLVLIFVILRAIQRKKIFEGGIFSLYVALYSFFRFWIDFLRGDNPTYWMGLTVSQIISIAIFLVAMIYVIARSRRRRSNLIKDCFGHFVPSQ